MTIVRKKIIGILAGMGPKSTAPFIDAVVAECQSQYGAKNDIDFPEMLILSLPTPFYIDRTINDEEMISAIVGGLRKLQSAGVSFIAMPCNSAHIYFDRIRDALTVPLLNIIDETLEYVPSGARVTLFATRPTFDARVYQQGIEAKGNKFIFDASWQSKIDRTISSIKAGELEVASQEWAELLQLSHKEGVQAIISACTDLNVVSKQTMKVPFIDSGRALARAVVREYLKG